MRVIIFEDELLVAKNLSEILLSGKLVKEVQIVSSLENLCREFSKQRYDLAILDVNIRGNPEGIVAGRYIRENYRMGIIYLTAYTDDNIIDDIAKTNPDAYLIKPFEDQQFVAVVRQVLMKYSSNASLGNISVWRQEHGFAQSKIEFFQETIDQLFLTSITDQKGEIIYANNAFCKISGYSPQELLGQNHNIVNSGLHSKEFFAKLWQTVEKGEIWQGEIRNKRKDGTYYWISSYIFALSSAENNNTRYYISIRSDITSRKEAELELQEVLSNKMAELSDNRVQLARVAKDESMVGFNSILIHEIKRPLGALSMHLELLIKRYADTLPAQILDRLTTVRASTIHTIKLMSYLNQTFKRKGNAKKDNILIYDQIESILNFIKILFPYKEIEINFSRPQENLTLLGYNDAVFISIFNLLKNACEAFSDEQEEKQVKIETVKGSDKFEILVRDNKVGGIPKEVTDRLFSPITSTKESGSGLGLNITKHVLASMDAKVELIETNENGSCFKITIPL
jgi:PAS domain S-box-containing protein